MISSYCHLIHYLHYHYFESLNFNSKNQITVFVFFLGKCGLRKKKHRSSTTLTRQTALITSHLWFSFGTRDRTYNLALATQVLSISLALSPASWLTIKEIISVEFTVLKNVGILFLDLQNINDSTLNKWYSHVQPRLRLTKVFQECTALRKWDLKTKEKENNFSFCKRPKLVDWVTLHFVVPKIQPRAC